MTRKHLIVAIGDTPVEGADAIGGDKRLLKLGFKFELTGPDPDDGGPATWGAFYTLEAAQHVRDSLERVEQDTLLASRL